MGHSTKHTQRGGRRRLPAHRSHAAQPRRRRLAIGVVVLVASVATLSSAAAVVFLPEGWVALNPVTKLLTGVSLAAHASNSPVAIGGTTTVPTYAPRVRVNITMVTPAAPSTGHLNLAPNGNAAAATTPITWTGVGTYTATTTVGVGTANKIVFTNVSSVAVKLTVTIDAYQSSGAKGDTGPQGPVGPQGPAGTLSDGSVTTAKLANGAVTPAKLAPIQAWQVVGQAGQPTFAQYDCGSGQVCEWKGAVAFYKDPLSVVHVRISGCFSMRYAAAAPGSGACVGATAQGLDFKPLFQLPPGYRPNVTLQLSNTSVWFNDSNHGSTITNYLFVGSGGSISMTSDYYDYGANVGAQGLNSQPFQEFDFRADN